MWILGCGLWFKMTHDQVRKKLTAEYGLPTIVKKKKINITSESESEELELEELDESLELSEAIPVDSCRSTESAKAAKSGCSCFKILNTVQTSALAFEQ